MQVVQIQSVSLDELLERLKPTTSAPARPMQAGMITICNKKEAAGTLNISVALFDKLQSRGLVPCTVYAGVNNKGEPINRWAQHHLTMIRPVIDRVRHKQLDQEFIRAKIEIQQILGL